MLAGTLACRVRLASTVSRATFAARVQLGPRTQRREWLASSFALNAPWARTQAATPRHASRAHRGRTSQMRAVPPASSALRGPQTASRGGATTMSVRNVPLAPGRQAGLVRAYRAPPGPTIRIQDRRAPGCARGVSRGDGRRSGRRLEIVRPAEERFAKPRRQRRVRSALASAVPAVRTKTARPVMKRAGVAACASRTTTSRPVSSTPLIWVVAHVAPRLTAGRATHHPRVSASSALRGTRCRVASAGE